MMMVLTQSMTASRSTGPRAKNWAIFTHQSSFMWLAIWTGKRMMEMAESLEVSRSVLVINKARSYEEASRALRAVFGPGKVEYHVVRYDPEVPRAEARGLGVDSLPPTSSLMHDVRYLAQRLWGACRAR